ncbi:MAG: hypothetical protein WDN45_05515 [Caulobacteraceae bacterium]
MRPDLSGLMFDVIQEPVDGYIGEVTILPSATQGDFSRGRTPDLIASLIARGVSVQLSRPGPPGMLNAKVRINGGFGRAVETEDWPAFFAELRKVVEVLDNHDWEPFLAPSER